MDWNDKNQVREYKRVKAIEYRKKDPERIKQNSRRYRESHREELKEVFRIYNKSDAGKARAKKYYDSHPEKMKELREKRKGKGIKFKGKWIELDHNPRKGICAECHRSIHKKEIQVTNLHHFKYDESDPLAHTIELCVECHNQKEPRSRNKLGQFSGGDHIIVTAPEGTVEPTEDLFSSPWITKSDAKDGEYVLVELNPFYNFPQ